MMNDALPLGFALLSGVLAVLMSGAARRIGAPGAGLLCAVLIGALLGPTVLGRAAPTLFDRAWIGSEQETARLRRLDAEHGAWMQVADSRALELDAVNAEQIAEKHRTWQAQRNEILGKHHAAPRLLVLALAFLIVAASCVRRRNSPRGSFLLGAWLMVACGGVVLLVDRLTLTTTSQATTLWIVAGVAVATAATPIARPKRAALFASAQFATVLALIALALFAPIVGASFWSPLALLAAAIIGLAFSTSTPAASARIERLSRTVLAPAVVAITLLDIDLISATQFAWVPVVAWLAMSDLRWLVASIFLVSERSWTRAAISALPLMGGGWLAVAVIGFGFWTEQLSEVAVVWLLFAAVLAELEGDWRGSAARILSELRRTAEAKTG